MAKLGLPEGNVLSHAYKVKKKHLAKKMKAVDHLGKIEKWKDKDGYHAYVPKHDLYDQFSSAGDRKYRIGEWKKEAPHWKNK